jgi:DNA-binding SARP family transcriptional activator
MADTKDKKKPSIAKLTQPSLHGPVPRARLFARLDEYRATRKAISVVGPPGAGKTTLVASWLESSRRPALWYQMDSGDADVASFFHYLSDAALNHLPRGSRLPAFAPEYFPDLHGFSRLFFRELFGKLRKPATVVLDNYQELPSGSLAHDVIADAVVELPEGLTLVIISRFDLPPVYARFIANQEVATIEWEELRLTEGETAAVIARRTPTATRLSSMLHQRSGGWVAGLNLMIEKLNLGGNIEESGALETHETLFDYFASQIFNGLSPSEQRILTHAAVLPVMTDDSVRDLCDSDDAADLLAQFYRRHLFTDRRGSDPARYEFHALFRDFLLERLKQTASAQEISAVHYRAADLLVAASYPEAAISLYLRSADQARAVDLITKLAPGVLGQGRWQTLLGWITELEAARLSLDPWLRYWMGEAQMQQNLAAGRKTLDQAFNRFEESGDRRGMALCAASILLSHFLEYADFVPMDRWIAELDRILENPPIMDLNTEVEVYNALFYAFISRQPRHWRFGEVLARMIQLMDADLNTNQKVLVGCAVLTYYTLSNLMIQAQTVIDRISPLLKFEDVTPLNATTWWRQVGYCNFRHLKKQETEHALDRSESIARESGLSHLATIPRLFRAYYCASWNRSDDGFAQLAGLEAAISDARPMLGAQVKLASCLLSLARGEFLAAAIHARAALGWARRLGGAFFNVVWLSHGANALAAAGQLDEAESWIDEAWTTSEDTYLEGYRPNLLMTRAYILLQRGQKSRAHRLIADMVTLGRPEDAWTYLRTAPWIFPIVVEEGLAAEVEVPFLQHMVRLSQLRPSRMDIAAWPWPVKIYTLGSFKVFTNDNLVTFSRKAQRKPLDLLKTLVAFGGKAVDGSILVDALWPDAEGDDGQNSLNATLSRLRKLLANDRAILVHDGKYTLNATLCWTDARALEQLLAKCEMDDAWDSLSLLDRAGQLSELYRGHFLVGESQQSWMVPLREGLRRRVQRAFATLGAALETAGQMTQAIALYEQGLQLDNLAEELYRKLMLCHRARGDLAEASKVFQRCRQMLAAILGVNPSTETQAIRDSLGVD